VCGHVISEFIEKNRLTTRSAYYRRAADAGDGLFTFSVPLASGTQIDIEQINIQDGSVAEWLACWTQRKGGPGFKSQPRRCPVTVLGKLFTPIVPLFTKQQNW